MSRQEDLDACYELLDDLAQRTGGPRRLRECHGRMRWPQQGVYFFFEDGEVRSDRQRPRVVRVGTHGLHGADTTLWGRLRQHRGTTSGRNPGGGNHRGSIFRRHVGTALLARDDTWPSDLRRTWGTGPSADRAIVETEAALERSVSQVIGDMPFLWLEVPDRPDYSHERGSVERNAVALLSNYQRPPIDPPSPDWLGRDAASEKVRRSGLWNVNHVDETHEASFLSTFERYVRSPD